MDLPESDWKHLRSIKDAALNRFCERALAECSETIADPGRTAHERYLALFEVMGKRDEELSRAFDGLRRSTALIQLMNMRSLGLVTDEEMEGFTPRTQDIVASTLRGFD